MPPDERLEQRFRVLGGKLRPQRATDFNKTRLGRAADGGYVCIDDFAQIEVAISLGVGREASWDFTAADVGIRVFQYDHAIARLKWTHPSVHFLQRRIAAETDRGETIESIVMRHQLTRPGSALLKMDIEGDEWPVLAAAPPATLKCFSQIICELHSFDRIADAAWFERAVLVLDKLNESFAVVHIHANNFRPMLIAGTVAFPEVLEVTYASRARYKFSETEEIFPTSLDAPNDTRKAEHFLGRFVF